MQSVYYRNLGASQSSYNAALQCFRNRARSFPISGPVQANDLTDHVLNDHPEIFYVGPELRATSFLMKTSVFPTYLYSPEETAKLKKQLDATADEIIASLINDHQSDYDKVRAFHDYLKSTVEYAFETVGRDVACSLSDMETQTVIGALLRRRCVCAGIASAFKFLCDRIGLECWSVQGLGNGTLYSGRHRWNIVRINGYYHHVDVTWDLQYADSASTPNYGYLNLSDEEIGRDHTWDRKNYPECPSSPYNYFRVNNALMDCRAQLETFLYNSFQMEEEFIMFRVVRGSPLEREINGCLSDSIQRAAGRCKHIRLSSYRYSSIPEQLIGFLQPEYSYC